MDSSQNQVMILRVFKVSAVLIITFYILHNLSVPFYRSLFILISHLHKILDSDWLTNRESFLNKFVQLINTTRAIN